MTRRPRNTAYHLRERRYILACLAAVLVIDACYLIADMSISLAVVFATVAILLGLAENARQLRASRSRPHDAV